jgi:hypothetical protein
VHECTALDSRRADNANVVFMAEAKMWNRVGILAMAVLCVGVLGAWRTGDSDAKALATQRIRLIWPDFDAMATDDKALIARASVLCRLSEAKSAKAVEVANCLLAGAERDDEQGQHGRDNLAGFKRLYRGTIAAGKSS